ncbi:TlpA family protein disulfide reductase [Marixanthomonas ophiurae]|uniref:TlpA family protein disulfide reductase n=1 Tax=Marixanthomonas ophiurae TaxID=387659 RepID=A0A3E1QDS4_9FLAO|nr:TlpA disulfide reductase family protein [Marixanthomonas ophiurae]RFN60206.1 TlpA family protein disulfide reductase [Marixanthomonas ophiurae]
MKQFLKKNKGNILFLAVLALLIIPQTRTPIQVFVQRLISFSPSETDVEERKQLTDYNWNLTSLENNGVDFSESKGRVILINFWATWCPPCIAEMPSLQNLYDEYGERVDFYLVTSEEPEIVQRFMDKKGYTFPIYIQHTKAPKVLFSQSLPTTYLISKKGEIVIKETGAADWDSEKTKGIIDGLLDN